MMMMAEAPTPMPSPMSMSGICLLESPTAISPLSVKNTFIDTHPEDQQSGGPAATRRSQSVPPMRKRDEPEEVACTPLRSPSPSVSESTACSDDDHPAGEWEDQVDELDELPQDVRGSLVQAIEVVFNMTHLNVEGCNVEVDDKDSDRVVVVTFFTSTETKHLLPSIRACLEEELGPDNFEESGEELQLVLGGPFRFTLVDLTFATP